MKNLLPPNKNISPLLKLSRWSALLLGVTYGLRRQNYLVKKEARIAEQEAEAKALREAQLAKEKGNTQREEMLFIARQVGVPIPADFDQQYPYSK